MVEKTVATEELHKVITSFQPRFSRLATLELDLLQELTRQLAWHPRAELKVKLPRNLRMRYALWVVRNELPRNVLLPLEDWAERLIEKPLFGGLGGNPLVEMKRLYSNPRWVGGRLPEVLERALGEVHLYIRLEPKAPRQKVRRRGHRESSNEALEARPEARARRAAEESDFGELLKKQKIFEAQQNIYRRADTLLTAEALGQDYPSVSEWNQERSYSEEKFSRAFWPDSTEDPCDREWEDTEVYESSEDLIGSNSDDSLDYQACQHCKYTKGSLLCSASLPSCENGQKPL